jgi:hypothetical protein
VKEQDAIPSSLPQEIWQWKYTTSEHRTIDRAIAKWLLLDKLPLHAVEGSGFEELLLILEPRYKLPGRQYFHVRLFLLFHAACMIVQLHSVNVDRTLLVISTSRPRKPNEDPCMMIAR